MAKCQKLDDKTFLISKFSNTEVNRHFIKFSPKIIPTEFQVTNNSRNLKIRIAKKSFKCINLFYFNHSNQSGTNQLVCGGR